MLAELIEYCLTPCTPEARRLGYLREAVAIRARASRCRAAWRPHLERSRAFIMQAALQCHGHGTALVIGSGALLDIPLAELSGMFDRVLLADIVHPLSARWQARRFANARLVTVDVTGLAKHLVANPSDFGAFATKTSPSFFLEERPDFTVSANILSQLPLLPLARLKQTGCAPDELALVRSRILTGHLEWLNRLPGLVSLITDTQWRIGAAAENPLSALDAPCSTTLRPPHSAKPGSGISPPGRKPPPTGTSPIGCEPAS